MMLMFRKKKVKISKMLAKIMHRVESDLNIPFNAFADINSMVIDIADEVGGISMVKCVSDYLDKMRKEGEE